MSYIDSYQHEIVGLFGDLPVYHPLEDIFGSSDPADGDFACSKRQLVLGGGSGEHPGMVLKCAERAVAEFFVHNPEIELTTEQKDEIFESNIVDRPTLEFSAWSSADHYHFYKLCTEGTIPNKYLPQNGIFNFETWLLLGFGEFIFYSMPELAKTVINRFGPKPNQLRHIRYNNILILPPNMPVYANGGNAFFKS